MTVQESGHLFKSKVTRTEYPYTEGTDFGTTKQTGEQQLQYEESFVKDFKPKGRP
jgi:hypothetical protein